jgi:RNA polymerase sigma-70 factor (ECF subfamily)
MTGTTDEALLTALRLGDEAAFETLVERYGELMLRVALTHVRSRAVAEEVVQECWMGVLSGLDRFEGRSSLKTWIFRILTNRAKTRGERESRCTPFSALGRDGDDWPCPQDQRTAPDERLIARESLQPIKRAIGALPARQQKVLVLRDLEGWDSGEVCEALGLSEGNQRVLLHRARTGVRAAMGSSRDAGLQSAA